MNPIGLNRPRRILDLDDEPSTPEVTPEPTPAPSPPAPARPALDLSDPEPRQIQETSIQEIISRVGARLRTEEAQEAANVALAGTPPPAPVFSVSNRPAWGAQASPGVNRLWEINDQILRQAATPATPSRSGQRSSPSARNPRPPEPQPLPDLSSVQPVASTVSRASNFSADRAISTIERVENAYLREALLRLATNLDRVSPSSRPLAESLLSQLVVAREAAPGTLQTAGLTPRQLRTIFMLKASTLGEFEQGNPYRARLTTTMSGRLLSRFRHAMGAFRGNPRLRLPLVPLSSAPGSDPRLYEPLGLPRVEAVWFTLGGARSGGTTIYMNSSPTYGEGVQYGRISLTNVMIFPFEVPVMQDAEEILHLLSFLGGNLSPLLERIQDMPAWSFVPEAHRGRCQLCGQPHSSPIHPVCASRFLLPAENDPARQAQR